MAYFDEKVALLQKNTRVEQRKKEEEKKKAEQQKAEELQRNVDSQGLENIQPKNLESGQMDRKEIYEYEESSFFGN